MAREIRQEKEINGIQNGKVEVKLSLFIDEIMRYIRNPKNFTRKLLEIVNTLNKASEYKLSLKIRNPFYTNGMQAEKQRSWKHSYLQYPNMYC